MSLIAKFWRTPNNAPSFLFRSVGFFKARPHRPHRNSSEHKFYTMNALKMATIRSSARRRAAPRARPYFTDADRTRASDPFARLGLAWGATSTEIKDAYRRLARELHPDVSSLDPTVASGKFRLVREAYDVLTSKGGGGGVGATADSREGWSFRTWRSGDIIAQERTDVAGAARKRPVRPAESRRGGGRSWGVASLGHPDGRGAVAGRGEYLGGGGDEGDRQRRRGSSTFGTGNSKWVRRKEFRPWTPAEGHAKGVGKYRGNGRVYGWARASEEEKQDSDGVQDTDYGLQDT